MSQKPVIPESSPNQQIVRARTLMQGCIDEKTYEVDSSFRPYDPEQPMSVHTTAELLHCLERNPEIELESRVLCASNDRGIHTRKLGRKSFQEAFKAPMPKRVQKLQEADFFATDTQFGNQVGQDFVPLLGGPFYKNLYYYEDYIRMHSQAFYAYHHDPIAKAIVHITRDFTLGTGYEVQCDMNSNEGKLAMAVWKAFEEVNNLQQQVEDACNETSIYGEVMWWKLPGNQTKITYQLPQGEKPPVGMIPRIRLLDPSNLIEIVTYPEDITRRLFYVWLTPTQYQIYTSPGNLSGVPLQPAMKFIYQHIPAHQILHFKVNSVSNEKRGRSDLFPVLGYLKRLRDSVEYTLIGLQKVAAWSIDTEVDGSQGDIDNYVANQANLGTIAPAGSEFVHSKAIKRSYLGNAHGGGHTSDAFEWNMSMISAGVQIPISYFGMHLSGGTTRASAIVGTEPVAKKMESRREYMRRMIKSLWDYAQESFGLPKLDCNIIFPEIITQDRSAKLKDLLLAEEARWIKPERAANIAAKELQITNYDYPSELADMKSQLPEVPKPLIDPGQEKNPDGDEPDTENSLTSTDRKEIKHNDSSL